MSTNHMYFNLFDFIKTLPQAYVAGHAARTVAWRIDSLIVSAARSILRNVRDKMNTDLIHGIDDRAEQLRELALKDTAEKWFGLTGKDNAGEIETIRWLNAIRDQWQDLAQDFTSLTCDWKGQPRVYAIADEDLDRETDEKTSAVHFLRFEFTAPMRAALLAGAGVKLGCDHTNYPQHCEIAPEQLASLVKDIRA